PCANKRKVDRRRQPSSYRCTALFGSQGTSAREPNASREAGQSWKLKGRRVSITPSVSPNASVLASVFRCAQRLIQGETGRQDGGFFSVKSKFGSGRGSASSGARRAACRRCSQLPCSLRRFAAERMLYQRARL